MHVKSHCSLGLGVALEEELAARAAQLGYSALALTDVENLYGQLRFHRACRARGLRAITGVELRAGFDPERRCAGGDEGRLVVLARDRSGLESLCRLLSARRGVGARGGTLPAAAVEVDRARGLEVLSDDPQAISWLCERGAIAREQLGLLLVRPALARDRERAVLEAAERLGLPLVADLDVLCADAGQQELRELLAAIRSRGVLRLPASPSPRWLRAPAEVSALFADLPRALAGAARIAEACTLDLTERVRVPPAIALPPGRDAAAELEARCAAELPRRALGERHRQLLEHELAVIGELGLAGFFLVVSEIVDLARDMGLCAVGRGSAGSSLVVHLLGASPVDPLAHGLTFECFLHAGKSEWPDVDLDLASHRRDELIARVYARFGERRVATVAAHTTFQIRGALREGLRALGVPRGAIEAALASLPPPELDDDAAACAELDWPGLEREGAGALELALGGLPARGAELVRALVGRLHHVGAHPGGLVIADRELDAYAPLERAPKGVVITQLDAEAAAAAGLVKIDLLGNHALSEIEVALELASARGKLPAALAPLARGDWSALPWSDAATLALVDRGQTLGCFQLESPAMRSLLAKLPVRSLADLVAALALIRPGAAAADAKNAFVRRARGEESAEPVDPRLAERLTPTHGLLLYEEDVMALLAVAGGLTLAEADELRAAIVRRGGDARALGALEDGFVARARAAAGDEYAARRAWAAAVRFAAYSFNKAHAVSYGQLGFLTAYLKVHLPLELACALLDHHQGLYPLRAIASELARRGIVLRPPHVNASELDSTLEEESVRLGLGRLSALGRERALALLASRRAAGPFADLGQLLARVPLRGRPLEALVLSGACDGLAPLAAESYPFVHEAALGRLRAGSTAPAELGALRARPAPGSDPRRVELYRLLVRVRNELAYLGLHLTAHPMAALRAEATRAGCVPIVEAAARAGRVARLAGTAAALRRVPARRGTLAFLSLEDETALVETIAPPPLYATVASALATPGPFLVEGRVVDDRGALHVELERLKPFHARPRRFG